MQNKLKQRKKYQRKLGYDEKLVYFTLKIIGSMALFFIPALGIDMYHIFH